MKNRVQIVYWILVWFLGFNTVNYAQPTESSLLWEISGNGLAKKSYIFGTMHLICGADFELKSKVKKAFDDTEQMSFEINLSDPEELLSIQGLQYSEKSISSQLDAKQVEKLRRILRDNYQIELKEVEHWPGINIMSLMLSKAANCSDIKYYDLILLEMGLQRGKKIIGLEKAAEQFDVAARLYTAQDVLGELELLETYRSEFREMVQLYLQEDINGLLVRFKNEEYKDPIVEKALLTDRNKKWSEKIPAMISENSTMIVVGAAHLGGEEGVLQLLQNRGFTITPVFDTK